MDKDSLLAIGGFIAAILFLGILFGGGHGSEDTREWDCHTDGNGVCATDVVEYGSVSEETWNDLLRAGWVGDPNDGKEALYNPYAAR